VTVLPLHLRPGAREWFAAWLRREHPELIETYRAVYGNGSYADRRYRRRLADRVGPLLRRHGLAPRTDRADPEVSESGAETDPDRAVWPKGALPTGTPEPATIDEEQLSLL
jgi:hypothetical protein